MWQIYIANHVVWNSEIPQWDNVIREGFLETIISSQLRVMIPLCLWTWKLHQCCLWYHVSGSFSYSQGTRKIYEEDQEWADTDSSNEDDITVAGYTEGPVEWFSFGGKSILCQSNTAPVDSYLKETHKIWPFTPCHRVWRQQYTFCVYGKVTHWEPNQVPFWWTSLNPRAASKEYIITILSFEKLV